MKPEFEINMQQHCHIIYLTYEAFYSTSVTWSTWTTCLLELQNHREITQILLLKSLFACESNYCNYCYWYSRFAKLLLPPKDPEIKNFNSPVCSTLLCINVFLAVSCFPLFDPTATFLLIPKTGHKNWNCLLETLPFSPSPYKEVPPGINNSLVACKQIPPLLLF